jgi:hypothetical protein
MAFAHQLQEKAHGVAAQRVRYEVHWLCSGPFWVKADALVAGARSAWVHCCMPVLSRVGKAVIGWAAFQLVEKLASAVVQRSYGRWMRDHYSPARRHNHLLECFAPVAACLSIAARRKEATNQHDHTGWIVIYFVAIASGPFLPLHHRACRTELFGLFVRMRKQRGIEKSLTFIKTRTTRRGPVQDQLP